MSYRLEIMVHNKPKGDVWQTNSLRFATQGEASDYGVDMLMQQPNIKQMKVIERDDLVNARWTSKGLVKIAAKSAADKSADKSAADKSAADKPAAATNKTGESDASASATVAAAAAAEEALVVADEPQRE